MSRLIYTGFSLLLATGCALEVSDEGSELDDGTEGTEIESTTQALAESNDGPTGRINCYDKCDWAKDYCDAHQSCEMDCRQKHRDCYSWCKTECSMDSCARIGISSVKINVAGSVNRLSQ